MCLQPSLHGPEASVEVDDVVDVIVVVVVVVVLVDDVFNLVSEMFSSPISNPAFLRTLLILLTLLCNLLISCKNNQMKGASRFKFRITIVEYWQVWKVSMTYQSCCKCLFLIAYKTSSLRIKHVFKSVFISCLKYPCLLISHQCWLLTLKTTTNNKK